MIVAHAQTRTRVLPFELSTASRIIQIFTIKLLIFAMQKKKKKEWEQTVPGPWLTPVDARRRRRRTRFCLLKVA